MSCGKICLIMDLICYETHEKLNATGIQTYETLYKAIGNFDNIYDKILLVYYNEFITPAHKLVELLLNEDINSLFKTGYSIVTTDSAESISLLYNLMDGEFSVQQDTIYCITYSGSNLTILADINCKELTQDEIYLQLYYVYEKHQANIAVESSKIVETCGQMYYKIFTGRSDYLQYITLSQAMQITIQPSKHLRRVIMLFMYKESSELTILLNIFLLAHDTLQKYKALFVPIIWNVSSKFFHRHLQRACEVFHHEDIEFLKKAVVNEGGLFFFVNETHSTTPKIILSVTDPAISSPSHIGDSVTVMFEHFVDVNGITALHEAHAVQEIKLRFPSFQFESCTLYDLTKICVQGNMMLCFYTGNSKSKMLAEAVRFFNQNAGIAQKCTFIGWSTSLNLSVRISLVQALKRSFNIPKMEELWVAGKDCLYIFVPMYQNLLLHSTLDTHDGWKNSIFNKAFSFFSAEMQLGLDYSADDGPNSYQQMICNQLRDRDFDCFELDKDEGKYLMEKIQFAFFGPPRNVEVLYSENECKTAKKIYDKIVEVASEYGETKNQMYVRFISVFTTPLPSGKLKKRKQGGYNPQSDFSYFPVFGIRKCWDTKSPCTIFVDHVGRVYQSWDHFLSNNKYPKCVQISPKNGRYYLKHDGVVELELNLSPECRLGRAVLQGIDIGASVVGGISTIGGIITAVPLGLTIAPIVPTILGTGGVAVGIYSIIRSGMSIRDRATHQESLHVREAEARAAYISMAAASLCFVSGAANFGLSYAARMGATIPTASRALVNGVTAANLTASGLSLGNSTYDLINNWSDENVFSNSLIIVQLTSSVLFFGHAVWNAQSASTIIRNSQQSVFEQVLSSLWSNNQRKTFLKLLNATIQETGSEMLGKTQVISYIQKLDNVQDIIVVLNRDAKLFNKSGIKYAVNNGEVVFNGIKMDVTEFGKMSKNERVSKLANLSQASPTPPPSNKTTIHTTTTFSSTSTATALKRSGSLITHTLDASIKVFLTDGPIKDKIFELLRPFTDYIANELLHTLGNFLTVIRDTELYCTISTLYSFMEVPVKVCQMIIDFYMSGEVDHLFVNFRYKPELDRVVLGLEYVIILSKLNLRELTYALVKHCTKCVVELIAERGMRASRIASARANSRTHSLCKICSGKTFAS